jgi:GDP-4-dehydro-6-deoxy-D-mannose reductase
MRILVTGATGFAGRWLIRELASHGHEPVAAPNRRELDITDTAGVLSFMRQTQPAAVAHLAGISYAGDVERDPARALAVNEGGTRSVLAAAAELGSLPVLVSGSSEVYGHPAPESLPLLEDAPTRPDQPYGLSKLAQERVALELGAQSAVPVTVTRSFNHTGPGQRREFVAPALADRLIEARRRGLTEIAVGNLDVQRDLSDVRDVVRAYRLLLEGLCSGSVPSGTIVNVAAGTAVSIRDLFGQLASLVGVAAVPRPDPALVRANDPPLIVGDPGKLRHLTGWSPAIPLTTTLSDLVTSMVEL